MVVYFVFLSAISHVEDEITPDGETKNPEILVPTDKLMEELVWFAEAIRGHAKVQCKVIISFIESTGGGAPKRNFCGFFCLNPKNVKNCQISEKQKIGRVQQKAAESQRSECGTIDTHRVLQFEILALVFSSRKPKKFETRNLKKF